MLFYGQKPRIQGPGGRLLGANDVGKTYVVQEGQTLLVREGGGFDERETHHEFPAGTRVTLVRVGSPYQYSVTSVTDPRSESGR